MSQPDILQSGKRDWVPIIITAVTGLLGTGIIVSIFNSFISYVGAPYVQILIKSDGKDNRNASILVVNTGGAAATHVKLMVKAPEEIIVSNNFSTDNITLQKVNPKLLEGNMQRFVQGPGSLVNISLMIKAKPNINYTKSYAAFVTYDQGSNTGGYSLKSPQYMTYIIYFIIYVPVVIFIFYSISRVRRFYYKRRAILLERLLEERLIRIMDSNYDLPKEDVLAQLSRLSREAARYYYDGVLNKTDYNDFLKLDRERENLKILSTNNGSLTTPTKSVYKITRYTSEGKPITDEK